MPSLPRHSSLRCRVLAQVISQRIVEPARAEELWRYVCDHVPIDVETGERSTGNPLMLSMVISTYESRAATAAATAAATTGPASPSELPSRCPSALPETIAELYQIASSAMLSRVDLHEPGGAAASAAAVPHLTALLEATAFHAHAAERRIITEEHLQTAAVGLTAPQTLAAITRPSFAGAAQVGHYVQVRATLTATSALAVGRGGSPAWMLTRRAGHFPSQQPRGSETPSPPRGDRCCAARTPAATE